MKTAYEVLEDTETASKGCIPLGMQQDTEAPVGRHCIMELYKASPELLNDRDYVLMAIQDAVRAAESTLLELNIHCFEPQGITAIALLAESHLSFHSWPERGYAAVDIFTCGLHTDPEAATRMLAERFKSLRYSYTELQRGGNWTILEPEIIRHEVSQ